MTDGQVRELLERASRGQPQPDLLSGVRNRVQRRRRTRVGATGVGIVALTVVIALAVVPSSDGGRQSLLPARSPSAQTSRPVTTPSNTIELAVAAPPDGSTGGGPSSAPPCASAGDIATATLTATAGGVLGLIEETSTDKQCELGLQLSAVLLGADHVPLTVRTSAGDTTDLGYNSDDDLGLGKADLGFSWTGSYCGPPAAYVQITDSFDEGFVDRTYHGTFRLDAPISGATPGCAGGANDSALVVGTVAGTVHGDVGGSGAAEPVEPPPADWRTLSARIELPSSFSSANVDFTVVLTTNGDKPVDLFDPCPTYSATVSETSEEFGGSWSRLCGQHLVVTPGKPLRIPISFGPTGLDPEPSGSVLTVTWAIAGVTPATASANAR